MAAIAILPKMATTSTAAGTSTINHDYPVPPGKRWLFDYIELEFGTAAAGNTVDIQHPAGTRIWPQVGNFKKLNVDLASRYPRAVELEATNVLRIVFTRGTSSTIKSTVYIIERNI